MGGLLVATALTLLFLPALYAAWFRVRRGDAPAHPENEPVVNGTANALPAS
jgi:multidrug efflux pump